MNDLKCPVCFEIIVWNPDSARYVCGNCARSNRILWEFIEHPKNKDQLIHYGAGIGLTYSKQFLRQVRAPE